MTHLSGAMATKAFGVCSEHTSSIRCEHVVVSTPLRCEHVVSTPLRCEHVVVSIPLRCEHVVVSTPLTCRGVLTKTCSHRSL